MEKTTIPVGTAQAACIIGHRVLSHALDYDARTCHSDLLSPLAERLDQCVEKTTISLMHVDEHDIDEDFRDVRRLPLPLGGMQWPPATETAVAAQVAQFIEDGPRLRERMQDMASPDAIDDASGVAQSRQAAAKQTSLGATIGRFGLPSQTEAADPLHTNAQHGIC